MHNHGCRRSVCTDAHRWGKKLSSFASGSSPEGEAPREATYVWGLLLFVVAFNVVCFDLTRDAAAAADDELRAAVADALLPDSDDEAMTTLESLEAVYQAETALPETASKMTRLADRCDWNAWNMATITGEYDPAHTTIPSWRARPRRNHPGYGATLWDGRRLVRRRAARRLGFWGDASERDVDLAELDSRRRDVPSAGHYLGALVSCHGVALCSRLVRPQDHPPLLRLRPRDGRAGLVHEDARRPRLADDLVEGPRERVALLRVTEHLQINGLRASTE